MILEEDDVFFDLEIELGDGVSFGLFEFDELILHDLQFSIELLRIFASSFFGNAGNVHEFRLQLDSLLRQVLQLGFKFGVASNRCVLFGVHAREFNNRFVEVLFSLCQCFFRCVEFLRERGIGFVNCEEVLFLVRDFL